MYAPGIKRPTSLTNFNWSPGIGDPSIGGWLTVVLYLTAAFSCWRTASKLAREGAGCTAELRVLWWLSISFVALGINKQLDLQTALTELGRVIAEYQGWYGHRQYVQLAFILSVAFTGIIAAMILLTWARSSTLPTLTALMGTTLVLGFVLMRAASFHHMDRFIGTRILGIRWNWILEMGGIAVVLAASNGDSGS